MKVARAILIGFTSVAVLVAAFVAWHTFRLNVCLDGDQQLMVIRSKADAIDAAKKWIRKDPSFDIRDAGGAENFLRAVEHTPNCCYVGRSVTTFGVVLWDVELDGELGPEAYGARMTLTQCGEIIAGSKGTIQLRSSRG